MQRTSGCRGSAARRSGSASATCPAASCGSAGRTHRWRDTRAPSRQARHGRLFGHRVQHFKDAPRLAVFTPLRRIEPERWQGGPPSSAVMRLAVHAEVQRSIGTQASRQLLEHAFGTSDIRQDAVTGDEVELPARNVWKGAAVEIGDHESQSTTDAEAPLTTSRDRYAARAEIDGDDLGTRDAVGDRK